MSVITSDVMTSELMDVGIRPTGYRLPDEARVGRVRLQVSDLGASLTYYTGVLGLRVVAQESAAAGLAQWGGTRPVLPPQRRRPVAFRAADCLASITSPSCFPIAQRWDAS